MRGITEAQRLLDIIAGPRGKEPFKVVLHRITKLLNTVGAQQQLLSRPMTENRVRHLWRKEVKHVRYDERLTLQQAAIAKRLALASFKPDNLTYFHDLALRQIAALDALVVGENEGSHGPDDTQDGTTGGRSAASAAKTHKVRQR